MQPYNGSISSTKREEIKVSLIVENIYCNFTIFCTIVVWNKKFAMIPLRLTLEHFQKYILRKLPQLTSLFFFCECRRGFIVNCLKKYNYSRIAISFVWKTILKGNKEDTFFSEEKSNWTPHVNNLHNIR